MGIRETNTKFYLPDTMMHVTTLLIIFLFSAAAFERDEEMFNLIGVMADNLCVFATANSQMPDIKAEFKNLNQEMVEASRKTEQQFKNLHQETEQLLKNLHQETEQQFKNLHQEMVEANRKTEQQFKNHSQEIKNLSQEVRKGRLQLKGVKKSVQDLVVRMDPIIARHKFINKYFLIPISVAGDLYRHV